MIAAIYARKSIARRFDERIHEWELSCAFLGASPEEIKDVQLRMGRVWR